MKCEECGMKIKDKPVIEEIDSKKHYYCCGGCLEYGICRRDKPLKKLESKVRMR